MKVRDAMAKTVSSAMKSDRVIDIARKMKQEDAGFIPVVVEREEIRRLPVAENGRLVGVLSHGNLVQATKNKTAEKATEGVTRGA